MQAELTEGTRGFFHTLNTMPLFKKFGDPDFQGYLSFRGNIRKIQTIHSESQLDVNLYPGVFSAYRARFGYLEISKTLINYCFI